MRAVLIFFLILFSYGLYAQEQTKIFRDTTDGAFDISHWLFELHGFIPLVSVITEPALGYGAVASGVYFIPKEKGAGQGFKMPDIVGAGGGYTQNGSWFAGGGYAGFWRDDRIRYRGIIGYGDINLTYYGIGNQYGRNESVEFNMESFFFLQQVLFRVKESPFLVGAKYYLGNTKIARLDNNSDIDPDDLIMTSSGLGFIAEFETFNNILSPSRGIRIHLNYNQSLEFLGSDRNFARLTLISIGYIPFSARWNSGFRIESNLASESTPFYSMPYISLRGVPVLRYQGEFTLLAETEQFVNIYKRWSLVGFCGAGTTIPSLTEVDFGDTAWNAGGGFRYKIARLLGLQMGMDIARGPEDWAFYIVFGNSWLR